MKRKLARSELLPLLSQIKPLKEYKSKFRYSL